MFARHRISILACLLLSVSACKSGASPVEELCELALGCECSMPPYASVGACVADLNAQTDQQKNFAASNALIFSQSCFDSTLDSFSERLGCSTELTDNVGSCSYCAPVHGVKALGATCTRYGDFSDCAENLYCDDGICSDPCARLAAGEACATVAGSDIDILGACAEGLYCDFGDTRTCTARKPAGTACSGFDDCQEGLVCDANSMCAAEPGAGEACVFACAGDLVCESNICAVPPGLNEACTGPCATGLECSDANICVTVDPLICALLADD